MDPPTPMLTDAQVIQSILKPVNGEALKRAQLDNDRQRYHTGPATDEIDAGPYAAVLKAWVSKLLNNEEKYTRFDSLLRYPLPSSRLIDKAADEYLKAFKAEDRYIDLEMSSDTLKVDAGEYLDTIKYDDWLSKHLFNQCLRASGAVWVVDLPATPNTKGYAEPMPLLKEFGMLTDIVVNIRHEVEAVIYPMTALKDAAGAIIGKRYAALDDESFRVFLHRDGESQPFAQITNQHGLGRCPAGFIWHDRLDSNKPLRIQSPLHALFTDLDLLVVGNIFRQHADLYASFPIIWYYKTRCKYETAEGEQCNDGLVTLRGTDEQTGNGWEKQVPCPVCSKAKPIGPGSSLGVPRPLGKEDADLRDPAGFINAERDLLDYNAEKLESIKQDILEALTGDSNNVDQTKDAVNEDQVHARFEARKGIIAYWAENLEQTDFEIRSVLLALRYAAQFIRVVGSYGTEFHLLSPGQAIADYEAARKASLPMYQTSVRRTRIDKLLAGASESQMTRFFMLSQLEPYPDLPLALVPVGSDAWELKANFSQYVDRFERENFGLETFGKTESMATRISNIQSILYQYVTESKPRREVPLPPGGEEGGAGSPKR